MLNISISLGIGSCAAGPGGDIPISIVIQPGPDPIPDPDPVPDPIPDPDPEPDVKPDPDPDPDAVPGPAPEIVFSKTDQTLELGVGDGVARLTIEETGLYDGQYDFDASDLVDGPVNLVPATVTGTTGPGDILTSQPGLWVQVANRPGATVSGQWHRNGIPIESASGTTYAVGPDDAGTTLTMVETVADTAGGRTVASGGNRVPGSIASPADLGPKLVAWLDATSSAHLSQDVAGKRPVTATGQPVMRIADKSPRGNHVTATGIHNPGQGVRTDKGVRWQDASFVFARPVEGMTDGMEIHVVLELDEETAFCLLGHNRNTNVTFGIARGGSTETATKGIAGAVTYSANGRDLGGEAVSQDDLFTAWSSPAAVVVAVRGWSGTADKSLAANLLPLSSRVTEFRFSGIVRGIVVTQALSVSERAGLNDYLSAEASR